MLKDYKDLGMAKYALGGKVISTVDVSLGRREMPRKTGIEGLYYITHVNNLPSIFEKGILSHAAVEREGVEYTPVYDSGIVSSRREKRLPNGQSLWDYANLYFQPRNAMLYRLAHSPNLDVSSIAILFIKPEIIQRSDIFVTSGNAASYASEFYSSEKVKQFISSIQKEIDKEWWSDTDGSKRKMMAECLVPDRVLPKYIRAIYVGNQKAASALETRIPPDVELIVDTYRFFLPQWKQSISHNVSLIKGDMFLSRMQTLTISVNCVGVMGKGLASTTKYRFPDVYVEYQDRCKSKKLRMGYPYIHRRETSVLYDLSDDPSALRDLDSQTWFLIFPTKNHWKNDSDFNGIDQGMQWLARNYKKEGITSVALPALGCGLGKLNWSDVGPMMCRYLAQMDIRSAVYLPMSQSIPEEYLTASFLLSSRG